jgi:hypothetical protein
MQILLTPQESEDFFHTALCNGLHYFDGYGLELIYNEDDYKRAKQSLKEQGTSSICYEDVLMQILRQGNTLTLTDIECDGDYNADITLDMVHTRVSNVPYNHLMNMINEDDDAETADVIIQYVAFNDIIFG